MFSQHFIVQEFVPKAIYDKFKDNSIWFIDERIVLVCEYIRIGMNAPVTVNNWHTGGQYSESGYRMPNTETGAKLSQHKSGRAADIKVQGKSVAEVHQFIKDNWDDLNELGLTTIEDISMTPTWTHIDCRWTGLDELLIVKP